MEVSYFYLAKSNHHLCNAYKVLLLPQNYKKNLVKLYSNISIYFLTFILFPLNKWLHSFF